MLNTGNTGKDQRIISNLRPITLLNTLYKIVSGCVTARMKPILDRIIQPWQKAYINGRYIGEVTRTCYDIFNHANVFNKPGLLMLIDFSKAFDSISFNLILSTSKVFNFPEEYIYCIMTLLLDFSSMTLVNCYLSMKILLERGAAKVIP